MPKPIDASSKKHQIRRIVALAHETPWAITQPKLSQIVDLLERRAEGHLSDEEIEHRLGAARAQMASRDEEADRPYQLTPDGIAVIQLYGVLGPRMNLMMYYSGGTSTQEFSAAVEEAARDEEVKAIVLDVDSPGGSVLGTAEAAAIVTAARKAKPVLAVATGQMCSAAYWIGSAASPVIASESSQVGSIGVYSLHADYTVRDGVEGVRRTVVYAGSEKVRGNPWETLNQESRQAIEEEVNDYYAAFIAAVAANRRVSVAKVQETFGQGRSMVAPKALAAGLIDRIGTLSEIVAELGAKTRAGSTSTGARWPGSAIQSTEQPLKEDSIVDPKVKAKLCAMGLIDANADDAQAQFALKVWFAARGKSTPDSAEAILAGLGEKAAANPLPTSAAGSGAALPEAGQGQRPPPIDEEKVAAAERQRVLDIQSRGRLLGVEETVIQAAVDARTGVGDFLLQVTRDGARVARPVQKLEAGDSAREKFATAATEALLHRGGIGTDKPLSAGARELQYSSLVDVARESLRISHGRTPIGDPDKIAGAALGSVEAARDLGLFAADVPYHSPGDFPNLLSNLAGRVLDQAPRYRGTTFQLWARQRPSLKDFKPATLHRVGEFGELPLVPDAADFEQSMTNEEWSFIAVDSYGDEFAFTPRMMVDDDLGALMDALNDKQAAHDMTLNRLCVNLLTGNPLFVDGTALFAAGRGNLAAGGDIGAPSQATLAAARLAFRRMTGPAGRRTMNWTVWGLLIPEGQETTTEQLLDPNVRLIPITTATGEIFRGKVSYMVEPMLSAVSLTTWYAFADPALARAIVYAYQTGFESMQRRDYYNPKNNCRMFQFEGRFAAGINNPRGVYRNPV